MDWILPTSRERPQRHRGTWCPFSVGETQVSGDYCFCSVAKSCATLCNPMECSPSSSSVHGIFLVRILEWVVITFSRGSPWPRNQTHISCISCVGRRVFYCCTTWESPKSITISTFSSFTCHEVIGLDAMIIVFLMLSFKPAFPLSSFTLRRLFSSSSLCAIRVVSSAYRGYWNFSWQSWITALSRQRGLHNSTKLWAMPHRWAMPSKTDGPCHPTQMDHRGEFWQNMVQWKRKWQPTLLFLLWESHEQYKKAERYDNRRCSLQVRRYPVCYWGRMESNC